MNENEVDKLQDWKLWSCHVVSESVSQEERQDRTFGLGKTGITNLPPKKDLGAQWIMGFVSFSEDATDVSGAGQK